MKFKWLLSKYEKTFSNETVFEGATKALYHKYDL